MRRVVGLVLGLALTSPALAQQPAGHATASCAAMDVDLPGELRNWNGDAGAATATGADSLANAELTIGKGYEAVLLNTPKVSFSVQPEKPGGSVAYAGLFEFNVATEGSYAVALGSAAWIDVLEDGRSIRSSSFGHGPECTTIRKIVVFPLKAGKHVLQISANGEAKLKLMVAKKP
jgi:hypothetical protein